MMTCRVVSYKYPAQWFRVFFSDGRCRAPKQGFAVTLAFDIAVPEAFGPGGGSAAMAEAGHAVKDQRPSEKNALNPRNV